MTNFDTPCVLWVATESAPDLPEPELRRRSGLEEPGVEVRVERLGSWDSVEIPPGSRDEWGDVVRERLNVWANQLPPEGRIFVIAAGAV